MTMITTSFNTPVFPTNLIYYFCDRPRQQQRHQHYTEATLAQQQQQPHRQHRYNIGGDHSPLDYPLEAGISGNNNRIAGISTTLGVTPPGLFFFLWRQASAATTAASASVQHWGDHSPLDYYIILVAIGTTLGTNTAPRIILPLLEAGISGNNSAGTGIGTTLGATTAPWITILPPGLLYYFILRRHQ